MVKFTFIIPHKNLAPGLLRRCLDSIPHREDVEIIVVDDNSRNDIADDENFPGLNDSNTEVIFDKSGKGPGHARNIALQNAKGEWIFFADADDYFLTTHLEQLMKYCQSAHEDIICFANEKVDVAGNKYFESFGYDVTDTFSIVPVVDKEVFLPDCHQCWKRVVRHSFIKEHHLRFKEINYCEDLKFVISALVKAKDMSFCTLPIYRYEKRSDSVTVKCASYDVVDAMKETIYFNKYYKDNGLKARLSVRIHLLMMLFLRNKLMFAKMIVSEAANLGCAEAYSDYTYICRHFHLNPNLFRALFDAIVVKFGALRRRFV